MYFFYFIYTIGPQIEAEVVADAFSQKSSRAQDSVVFRRWQMLS